MRNGGPYTQPCAAASYSVPAHAIIIAPCSFIMQTCVACAPLRPAPLALTAPGSRRCGACASRDLVADGREAHLEDILVGEGEPRPGAEVVDAEGRPRGVGERVPTGQG